MLRIKRQFIRNPENCQYNSNDIKNIPKNNKITKGFEYFNVAEIK